MGQQPFWWLHVESYWTSKFGQLFGAICTHFCIYHCTINWMRIWFKSTQRQQTLTKFSANLAMKISWSTITHLHTWQQDGCHDKSSPKFPFKTLSPLNFHLEHRNQVCNVLFFQIILGHENSEPCVTQLRVQFYANISTFKAMSRYFGLLIGYGVAYFPMSCACRN